MIKHTTHEEYLIKTIENAIDYILNFKEFLENLRIIDRANILQNNLPIMLDYCYNGILNFYQMYIDKSTKTV